MDGGPGEAASGVLTLEGLGFQVAIGERGSQTQSVTTDEGGDVRGGEGQGCPCDLVQQTWHPAGYSAFRACKRQEGREVGRGPPTPPQPRPPLPSPQAASLLPVVPTHFVGVTPDCSQPSLREVGILICLFHSRETEA